ncbi:MAG: Mrp/NBP35 family ATP-binding protein [Thermodesulfobacteriota bacterium]|nr:Mrp/NBP35 family ATP-binding protein [Thermodesulfobacteriota bacterium]
MSGPQPDKSFEHQIQDKTIENTLKRVKHKILVLSGKGGVGKSTVAVNLAVGLAGKDRKVGLIDVDLHGPSVPRMLGLTGGFQAGEKPKPMSWSPNLSVVSIEPLLPDHDKAVIWRGPIKIGVIRQFISDLEWDELDYLVVDSPPGTGDEPLTVAQTIPGAQALIVTTPQEVALADVRKSIDFCHQVNMPILGLIENMNGMVCPHCGKPVEFFKSGGGSNLAKTSGLPLISSVPFVQGIVKAGDTGQPDSKPFEEMVSRVIERMEGEKAG